MTTKLLRYFCLLLTVKIDFLVYAGEGDAEEGVAEGCTEHELSFGCREVGQQLAITQAWLYGASVIPAEKPCSVPQYNLPYKKGTFLQYINKQCSGKQNCQFRVFEHIPGAAEKKKHWGNSVIRTTYQCLNKTSVYRTCGTEVAAQSGWLQNVGYPQYYLGDSEPCSLAIKVDDGQRILITITDLSLREISQPNDVECRDTLAVTDGSKQLFQRCGDIAHPQVVTSEGNSVNVTLSASATMFPKRGFSARFQALGCQIPKIPENGYVSFRNATYAEYWCCVRHVYPDTLTRQRILRCTDVHRWNDTLPDCIDLEELLNDKKISRQQFSQLFNGSGNEVFAEKLQQSHVVFDLIVPTLIMSLLALGNIVVIVMIIYCRRHMAEDAYSEELDSIKANAAETDVDVNDSMPCSV